MITIEKIFENSIYDTITFSLYLYDDVDYVNPNIDKFHKYIRNSENFSYMDINTPKEIVIEFANILLASDIPFLVDTFYNEDDVDGAYYYDGKNFKETNNNLRIIREVLFMNKIISDESKFKFSLMKNI